MEKAFLLPGEFGFYKEPTHVSTVLGSCVAVALYDSIKKQGGLNHFLLPDFQGGMIGGKVGDYAVRALIKNAMLAGSLPTHLSAKIFGGANVVTAYNPDAGIGHRNIEMARQLLESMKIPIIASDTGGESSRRIVYDTYTSEVRVYTQKRSTEQESARAKAVRKVNNKPGVLVVDDSSMVRNIVVRAIEKDGRMQVIGTAADPYEAKEKIIEYEPDVISLDIMMPKMNGLDFLKRIMYYRPIPTVVLSTLVREGNQLWSDLKKAGALSMVNKDDMKIYNSTDNLQEVLIPKLLFAAGTKVAKRQPPTK